MLWRKIIRDLIENKGAYLACLLVIVMGLMVFTAFSTLVQSLKSSQRNFYEHQNFADGFVQMAAMPLGALGKISAIEGIEALEGRLVEDVLVWKPDIRENVYLRLVSIDPGNPNPINSVLLSRGKSLDHTDMEIWLDQQFFVAHNLNLGDQIEVIVGGRRQGLSVVGVGDSPEFVYPLRTLADLYPTPETFGIAFIPWETMRKLFPQTKAYNELVFTLTPGADYDLVKESLEVKLAPYGLKSIIPREEQTSHFILQQEIDAVASMSKAMPVMFLTIAAMILYITLKRLIEQQRGQIGILKAEGYTDREILLHYLSYALIIGFLGGLMGGLLGSASAYPLASLFKLFFNLPGLEGAFSISYLAGGIILSLTFALLAGYQGCKKVLALEPAEAMRPPAPISGKKIWLENIRFLWKSLSTQGMMALRNLSRNKRRSLFIFVGITICFAISGFTFSMNDLMQKMLFDQYEKVETYDVKITLNRPFKDTPILRELESFPGVNNVEPMAEIPVTLTNKWQQKEVAVLGIPENSRLYHILDDRYNHITPPKNGLLLSERLAELLDAPVGTTLTVESPLKSNDRPTRIEVIGIIPQYVGINAYMEIEALQSLLGQKGLSTAFMLNIDPQQIPSLKEKYLHSKVIGAIEGRQERLGKLMEMMDTYGSMIYIYAFIGVIIGFVIIYSSAIITMAERQRELASMMVLGMTPKEVLSVVTIEQWSIALPALIVGIPLSKGLMAGIGKVINSDLFTIPNTLSSTALLLALVATSISIWMAQKAAARRIKGFSLSEVLSSRE